MTSLAIGGTGGGGGDTFYQASNSQATNTGTILTFGADATGIIAQSIGGGGGDGGKAGTSLGDSKSTGDGGNSGANNAAGNTIAQVAANFAANGTAALGDYNSIAAALNTANTMLGNTSLGAVKDDDIGDDLEDTAGSGGETDDDNQAVKVSINVGIGGAGGAGGAAGFITVNNTGTVATTGKAADGIVVQAIGGGGGKGGAASTASSADISGNVSVGGSGGGSNGTDANNGGRPSVTNSGEIYTVGPLAAGIVTQSIAGGGGIGGSSTATAGTSSDNRVVALNISVGGGGGGGSISEASQVTSSGAIETRGHDATGIIAQSIAGGGGIVKTLATDLDNQGGAAAASSKDFAANIKIGNSSNSSSGNSGAVLVTTQPGGSITTAGDDSYGVLAQSISGGGGVALGGKPEGSSASDFFSSGHMTGYVAPGINADPNANQGVQIQVGDAIQTAGKGGVGVFAQSIGGGGGISGDVGWTMQKVTMGRNGNHTGNGGDIEINVNPGGSITTASANTSTASGGNAPGIIAQSIGGGGGWFTNKTAAFTGSAGGVGIGGTITMNIQGSIDAQGPASAGIIAQSVGGGSNGGTGSGSMIAITIGNSSNPGVSVKGGNGFDDDAAAVRIEYGLENNAARPGMNTLVNWGTIDSHENDPSTGNYQGTAIYGEGGYTSVTNYGTINGQIHMGSAVDVGNGNFIYTWGSIFNFGTINPGLEISLGAGTLTNNGKLSIGGDGHVATTRLLGNYVQNPSGQLVIDVDPAHGSADRLDVTGSAQLAGQVLLQVINPASLKPGKAQVDILTASGGINDHGLKAALGASPILSYAPIRLADTVEALSYTVDFAANNILLGQDLGSSNRLGIGGAINAIQEAGGAQGFRSLVTTLAEVPSAQALADLYDSLSGAATADAQQVMFGVQQSYQSNILQHAWVQFGMSAPTLAEEAAPPNQTTEVWVSGFGGNDQLDGTDGQRSLHSQTAGSMIGIDHSTDAGIIYGLSLAGASSDFSVSDENTHGNARSVNAAVYGLIHRGEFYLAGTLSFGHFSNDVHRYDFIKISGLPASADEDFGSNVAGGRIEAGWTHNINWMAVTPYSAIDLDELWQRGFSETVSGSYAINTSGLGLRYGSVSRLSAPLTLGLRASTSVLLGDTHRFSPYLDLGWVHEFNPSRAIEASFLAAPNAGFTTEGVAASRNAAHTIAGGTLSLTARLSAFARFDGQFSDVETNYGGDGGLEYRW